MALLKNEKTLIAQIQSVDVLKELYPQWQSDPKVSIANAINSFENRPSAELKPIPDSVYELMLYLINDSDYDFIFVLGNADMSFFYFLFQEGF